jgi:predicted nucleic-acid-binding Zn-ribbon protein
MATVNITKEKTESKKVVLTAKRFEDMSKEEIEQRKKNVWKELNKLGIYTMEEFEEAYKNRKPIDFSCVTAPTRKVEGVKMPASFLHCDCKKCGYEAWSLKKECKCYKCGATVICTEQTPDEVATDDEMKD